MSIAAVSSVAVAHDPAQGAQQAVVAAQTAGPSAATAIGQPNPTIQLDPAINVVVTQLHNRQGELVSSIPTERHLQAYRIGLLPVPSSSAPTLTVSPVAAAKPDPAQQPVAAAAPSTPVAAATASNPVDISSPTPVDTPAPATRVAAATPSTPVGSPLAPAAPEAVPSAVASASQATGGSVHAAVPTLAVAASPLPPLAPTVATPVTPVADALPSNQIATASRTA